jgi:anaerobic selenocysteine-containing dehydrogenase
MGGLQLLYNADYRFTSPMKRVGPRGAGRFVPVSWKEALEMLAARISDLRKKGTPEALVGVDGNRSGSTMSALVQRLLQAVGSPNYMTVPTLEDTYDAANALMVGTESPMAYDLEHADYILSFGAGLIEGWGSPGRVLHTWGRWHEEPLQGKVPIVQIESRASTTASKSDQWMAVKPGTEAALALGMAHVIIKENAYDEDFLTNHAHGFESWLSADGRYHKGFKAMVLESYAPAQVAQITGLSAETVVSLAKAFAKAKAPIAVYGKGKGVLNSSLYECMAVQSLNGLVGNINKPGGVLVHDPLPLTPLPDIYPDAVARKGLDTPRLDQAGTTRYPFSRSLFTHLSRAIVRSKPSPVDTLLVFAANPAYSLPDGGSFRKALARVPFIVSFSPYRDETAMMADLVLPDHTYLEKMDDVVWPMGLQYPLYGLMSPVVEPVYNTQNSGDAILRLAKQMGGSVASAFPWKNYEEVLKLRAEGLYLSPPGRVTFQGKIQPWKQLAEGPSVTAGYDSFEDMWKKVKSSGFWYRPSHSFGWAGAFKTPTGKFEFYSTRIEKAFHQHARTRTTEKALEEMGLRANVDEIPLPHYEPVPTHRDASLYPLVMVPYEMVYLSTGWLPSPPFHKKTIFPNQLQEDESFADIHPRTAAEHGLGQDDRATVETPRGKLQVRVNLFEGAMPGMVYIPMGFGHTAYDEFLEGKGVNPLDIVHAPQDPLSGYPLWWHTPAKITKV